MNEKAIAYLLLHSYIAILMYSVLAIGLYFMFAFIFLADIDVKS